jgi:RNA polymerase sigma-70 factor, ECF subfamily
MAATSPHQISKLLLAWSEGEEGAYEQLIPLVYEELHRLASRYMRKERSGHTLQTSALVNEAYLRLVGAKEVRWQNRAHFFAVSARLMRRILVDFARAEPSSSQTRWQRYSSAAGGRDGGPAGTRPGLCGS